MAIELAKAYVQIVPSAEGIQGSITTLMGGEASRAGDHAGTVLGSRLVTAVTGILSTAAIGKTLASSITSGAALEQSIGGIETIFKDSADAVKAAAADAYKTAGLSANDYMEQTTSFAASLLQSLGNDTRAAADVAQMAMTDMSDNANKMGTDMVSIQNAYQGFAKQNYTMLDNLKLGYGGTKTEMERLLADAEKISGVQYDLSSLADVYNAIHVIQTELDITGTTAKEAETTLSGSFSAMKAAASNVLGNLALGEDLTSSLEALSETAQTFLVSNLLPAIGNVLSGIPQIAFSLVPQLLQSGTELIQSLSDGFIEGIPAFLASALPQLLQFTEQLRANFGDFVTAGVDLILNLANGIVEGLPQLFAYIPDIVINIAGLINDNAPKILAGGVALVVALGGGILNSIPLIVQNFSKITEAILAVISAVNWLNLGANILTSIGNGVKSMASGLLNAFKGGFSSALSWIKSLPSQAVQWGKNLIQSFINGLTGKGGAATIATVGIQVAKTASQSDDGEWSLSDDIADKAEVNAIKMQNLAKSTESVLTTAASKTASAATSSASKAAQTAKTVTQQAAKTITESVISSQTDAATSYALNQFGRVTTATSELTEKILKSDGSSYDRFTKTVTESGKELVNGVVKNYKTITKTVKGENGEVTSTTQKTYEDAAQTLTSTLTRTSQTLVNGISTTVNTVTQLYADGSSELVTTTTETGKRLVNGVLETYTKVKKIAEDGTETVNETVEQLKFSDFIKSSNSAISDFGSKITALGEYFDSDLIQNVGDFFTEITDGVEKVLDLATSTATLVTTLQELKTTLNSVKAAGGVSGTISGIGKLLGVGGATAAAGTAAGTTAAGTGLAALGLSIPQLGLIVAGVLGVSAVGYGIYKWATKNKTKDTTASSNKLSYTDLQDAYWYGNERAFAGYDYRTDPYTFGTAQSPMKAYQDKMQSLVETMTDYVEQYLPQAGNNSIVLDDGTLVGRMAPQMNAEMGQLAVLSGRGN